MTDRDRVVELIGLAYEAATAPDGWPRFLESLVDAVSGSMGALLSHDIASHEGGAACFVRSDPEGMRAYDSYYHQFDPWARAGDHLFRVGSVVTGEEIISAADLRRTTFFNEYARQYDMAWMVGTTLSRSGPAIGAFLSCQRAHTQEPFGPREVALLQTVAPHIVRAMEVQRRLLGADALAEASQAMLDRIAHGVFVFDAAGRLMVANRAAQELLRARDGLVLDRGELCAANGPNTVALRRLLHDAIATSGGLEIGAGGGVMELGRPSGRTPLRVVVAPAVSKRTALGPEPACAIIFVTDPERLHPIDEEGIRTIFGLTPGEARLACAIAEGLDLQHAASRLGLTLGTVRTRLKTIFEKTGTHRQADLVRLILTGAPPGLE